MNYFDVVTICWVLFVVFFTISQGFVKTVMHLLIWIIAIVIGIVFLPFAEELLTPLVEQFVFSREIRNISFFLVIVLSFRYIIGAQLLKLIGTFIHYDGNFLFSILSALIGAIQAIFVLGVVIGFLPYDVRTSDAYQESLLRDSLDNLDFWMSENIALPWY